MRRSTIVALVVFVVLLVAVLLMRGRPVQRGAERLHYPAFDAEAVSRLTISDGSATADLERVDGVWRLASGRLADPDAVRRALDAVSELDTSDVVSTSSERHEAYGVDSDGGVLVDLQSESTTVASLVLGEPGSGGGYLRRQGGNTVFQAAPALRSLFPVETDRWLKLKLIDAELDELRRVEIALAGATPYSIVPSEQSDEWSVDDPSTLPENFRFDGAGARTLAAQLVSVRAKGIVDDEVGDDTTGMAADHDRLTAFTDRGSFTLHLGAATDDDDSYARVDARDALFVLPAYRVRALRKELTDLRDLRPMAFDPAAATALRIRDGRTEYRFARDDEGVWQVDPAGAEPPNDFELDQGAVDRTLQSLASLRAHSLAENVGARAAGMERPNTEVTASFGDGSAATLSFGREAPDDDKQELLYATGNADDQLYRVAVFHRDRFSRGWEIFRPAPTQPGGNPFANLDPETLKNLPPEVRESLLKQMEEERRKQQLMEQIRKQQGQ